MKKLIGTFVSLMVVGVLLSSTACAEVNYTLTVTDKTGTVFKGTATGAEKVGGHDDIDLTQLKSYRSGDEIIFELTVVGTIQDNDSYDYDIRIDTNGDEEEDYEVEYENKSAVLSPENGGGETKVNYTIAGGTLKINFTIELLGEPSDFDIMSQTAEYSDASYIDLSDWASWQEDEDDDSPGFGIAAALPATVACAIFVKKRRS